MLKSLTFTLLLFCLTDPLSQTEDAARALATSFYQTWAAKDLDGWARRWSAQAPELVARKKAAADFFAQNSTITLQDCAVRQVKMQGDRAYVRIAVSAQVIHAKTGKTNEGYAQRVRTLECVKENNEWKVWRETSAYDDFALTLIAAQDETARTALLAAEKELVTVELARALREQTARSINQGNYPLALANSLLGQRVAEQLGDQGEVGYALTNIGYVYTLQGNLPQAKEPLQKGLALMQSHGQKADVALALNLIGNVYRYQGDYEPALDYYRQSLAVYEALGSKFGIGMELGNIGVVYARQGNFALALDYYQKGLALSEAENDKLGVAITLGNIGALYRKQGDYAQAVAHYQKSMALSEAIDDQVGIAQMLHNLSLVARLEGNHTQALEFAQKNLAMTERRGDKSGIAGALSALALVYEAQDQFEKAAEYYQKALALDEANQDKDSVANTLVNLGVVYKNQGRFAQALDSAERATALARQTSSLETLFAARTNAALALRGLKQNAQARRAFEEAIAVLEAMRAQVAGREQEQQRFLETRLAPYLALMDMLAEERQAAEALTFAERAKARVLLDVFQSGRRNITKAMTEQEQEQERAFKAELNVLNTQVTRASRSSDASKFIELKAQRDKTRLRYEAFQTALYAAHPDLRTQRGEAPIIKADELTALVPDAATALLEYVVLDDMTYLFTVTQSGVKAYSLPLKRDELNAQTETLRKQLAARDLGFRATAKQLYAALLKPALAELRGKTNLIIVPDGKLWELPFQTLIGADEKYVLETSAVSYAPSLTVLREMMKPRPANSTATGLLAFGNPTLPQATLARGALALRGNALAPLPEAEQEVKALGQLYGATQSKLYVGAAASEERAKTEAAQARILHFTTHGVLNDAAPMYSHLVLAQSDAKEGKEDGLLEAWELMQMDLKADLAVLSACETARGRIGAGEGMIGLTWALFVAGVPSTVVSQWKVESAATRELMIAFHRQMRTAQTTKAAALRQAALSVMRRPATSHPFYWAGFVLVGDGR